MTRTNPMGLEIAEAATLQSPLAHALLIVRSLVFAAWMFGLAMVMGLVCLPVLLTRRRWALSAIQLWARGCLACLRLVTGLRVEVRGGSDVTAGPALIGAKHQGMLDILVGLVVFPDPCFVMKKELMWIPIFGWFSAKAQMIAIDRSAGPSAVREMVAGARRALSQHRQVIVYPEGTRRAPGAEPAYKPGVAGLYRDLAVPCHPLATNSGLFWPATGLAKYPGTAVFQLLAPIPPGLKRTEFICALREGIETASQGLTDSARVRKGTV